MKTRALLMSMAATFASPLLVYAHSAGAPHAEAGLSPLALAVLIGALFLFALSPFFMARAYGRRYGTGPVRRGSGAFDAVIAVVGHKAAGKDELSRILEKRGFTACRISDAIRAEAARRGNGDPSVFELQEIGNEGRAKNGSGFWAEQLIADFERDGVRRIVVNGIRNPGEVESLMEAAGDAFILVGVTAPYDVRETRFLGRGQAGDTLTKESFAELDAKDRGKDQPDDGQQVDRCMAMVWPDNLYDNDGSLEDYRAWIEEFLDRYGLGSDR